MASTICISNSESGYGSMFVVQKLDSKIEGSKWFILTYYGDEDE
jgi:hypothetical protein